jgi:hypothetical protein
MAHHCLGQLDLAKRWLDKVTVHQPRAGSDFFWDDVDIRILCREAEPLIVGSRPRAPSPTSSDPSKKAAGDPGAKLE